MELVKISYIGEREYNRDFEAEKKEREQKQYAYRDYWEERERWDSWEERGNLVGCPFGNCDEKGRDMDDSYYEAEAIDYEEMAYRKKEPVVKKETMDNNRIAYRAALLQKFLGRTQSVKS